MTKHSDFEQKIVELKANVSNCSHNFRFKSYEASLDKRGSLQNYYGQFSNKSDSYLGIDNGKGANFSQIRTLND